MPLTPDPFTLVLDGRVQIPGETVFGRVNLNVRNVWNDNTSVIRLKIRGTVETRISRNIRVAAQGQHTVTEKLVLIKEEQALWQRSDIRNLEAMSDLVHLPFTFTLPRGLPPSCHTTNGFVCADVQYYVEVVAERPGHFLLKRRSRSILKVGSALDDAEQLVRYAHLAHGPLPWLERSSSEQVVHPFPFQAETKIRVQLALPDIPALPVSFAIPFRLRILIRTCSPQSDGAREEEMSQNSLFPIAISDPRLLKLDLWRKSTVRASCRTVHRAEEFSKPVPNAGGLGSPPPERRRNAHVRLTSTATADLKPGTSIHSRIVCIESTMVLGSLPSFRSALVGMDHFLRLSIPIKNQSRNLKFDFSISLVKVQDIAPPAYHNESTLLIEPPPAYESDRRLSTAL